MEKGEGAALSDGFPVDALPGFVLADATGEPLGWWAGFTTADAFVAQLDRALAARATIGERRARIAVSPTLADAVAVAEYHAARREWAEADEMYERAESLDTDGSAALERDIAFVRMRGYHKGVVPAARVRDAFDGLLAAENVDTGTKIDLVRSLVKGRIRNDDGPAVGPLVTAALSLAASEPGVDGDAVADLEVARALFVARNVAQAVVLKQARLGAGWEDDHDRLNQFAWWCFEQRINLDDAAVRAARAIELAPTGPDRADALDTLAEIRNAQGRRAEAIALETRAIAADPSRDVFRKALERFRTE